MSALEFALTFRGQAAQVNDDPVTLEARTTAQGLSDMASFAENEARFQSRVVFTGDGEFQEDGVIDYGDGDTLEFSTVGSGHIGPSAVEGLQHGAVSWRIDKGTGRFENASGLITSNFTVDAEGGVTDRHFVVLHA